MIYRCDLARQYIRYKKEIDRTIVKVLNSGSYTLGNEVKAFESEFANYLKVRSVTGVANGTDALILAMKILGIGKGDEVITTAFTAFATVSAIVATGAIPVFADIDPDTYLIDLEKISQVVSSKTKAVMPVHIFGNVVDIPKLKRVLGHNLPVIEDACQAHGSHIRGKLAGSMGEINAFSFYPTKNVGAYGDGGAIATQKVDFEKKAKLLRMYGMKDKDHIIMNGINSRLDELQAAILRIKLKHLDESNKERNKIALLYRKNTKERLLKFQKINNDVFCNYHVLVARLKGNRQKFVSYLDGKGIQTNVYYPIPLHLQMANRFLKVKKGSLPETEELCREVVALPLYPELPEHNLEYIINSINKYNG
jgi:dTDP-4-amino-4,6-dideoxygalactose transaminase